MIRRKITPGLSSLGSPGGYKRKSFSEIPENAFVFDGDSISSAGDSPDVLSSSVSSNNGSPDLFFKKVKDKSPPLSPSSPTIRGVRNEKWPGRADDYKLEDVIGFGASAVVHAGFCIPRNEKCAIKRINLEQTKASMDEILKEIQAMCFCHHENVVNYYTSFVVDEELWIILKLHEGGSLLDVIKQTMKTKDPKHGVLDEEAIATVCREVLKGLDYLHKSGHIHRDIKAGNILVSKDGSIQIADFGVSAVTGVSPSSTVSGPGDRNRKHTFVGTPCWMSPEVMQSNGVGYDFKTDIWSLGITVIEMVRGTVPYMNYPPIKILMQVMQDESPKLETNIGAGEDYTKNYGKSIRSFISACLTKDPAKRPTAAELLKHNFIKKGRDRHWLQSKFALLDIDNLKKEVKTRRIRRRDNSLSSNAEWEWTNTVSQN